MHIRRLWVIALPVATAVLGICMFVAWLLSPQPASLTVLYSGSPAYIHDRSIDYLNQNAAEVALGDNIWLRAELVQQQDAAQPQLLFFLDCGKKRNDVLVLDIAQSLLDSPTDTGSQSYLTCLNGQLLICLDAAAAPGCTPYDTLGSSVVYVDETTLCPGVTTCLEEVNGAYRSIPLGGKYYLALTWVPEDYCLTFGAHTLTARELQAALLLVPYGYRSTEG